MSFSQNEYYRFLDSAKLHIQKSSISAQYFLDSIPHPIDNNLTGRLSEYYSIKALMYDEFNEYPKVYQSHLLALKYGKIEKNYKVAGRSCLELYAILSNAKKDSLAQTYLNEANSFFKLTNYTNGLFEVEQIKIYIKFLQKNHKETNYLLLSNLDKYENITDDAYFYMFALYMITSNHLSLNNIKEAKYYFNKFKKLRNNKTISFYNFKEFNSSINTNLANYYNRKENIDSTLHYLKKASKCRNYMADRTVRDYLMIFSDVYKKDGVIEKSKNYIDSLRIFEDKIFSSLIDTGHQISHSLLKVETKLEEESKKNTFFEFFLAAIFAVLLLISIVYFVFYKKQKVKLNNLDEENKQLNQLKNNHEKLTVKVQGLEDYINNLKSKAKVISSVNDVITQRDMIKDFYRDIRLESSTVLNEGNHLELINDFNINFFNKLKKMFPSLNDSDIIICYHIYIGFKNKEIAVFLNTSIRGIESKRYRITKKMNLDKNTSLASFLYDNFDD
ncbi:hypothetical protein FUA26_07155 [Seonamhaeicola algicola]|uniref:Uncharacterized protein n=1 Tax=Seonamhaeicola algicola TaxID=1719036 RepID=A0A5C7AZE4_9FLAO|nr:LuxR C-terminal-related transcriptional regulator [Seonamhaeicola algicola]TXE11835.1 hypothetical protein FUA26_07155 [Seonamhaeicola algicola]